MKTKIFIFLMAAIAIAACKPNEPTVPQGEKADKPSWKATVNPQFASSMTIICVPPEGETITAEDEVAAFWGDSCRGAATPLDGRFYLGISGPEQDVAMEIKYYSGTYKMIRTLKATYSANAKWGSTDAPYRLNFTTQATPQRITLKGELPNEDENEKAIRKVSIGEQIHVGEVDEGWLLYWRTEDQVRLQDYNSSQWVNLTICGGVDTHYGDFEGWWELKQDENCYVTYPTSATFNSGNATYTIPAEQTYVADNFANGLIPMYGGVQRYETIMHFDLHPMVAVLCLPLTSAGGKVVTGITVTVPEEATESGKAQTYIAGNFTTAGVTTQTPTVSGGNSRTVTLNCGSGVSLSSEAKKFLIVLPAVTMKEGTSFTIAYEGGSTTQTSKKDLTLGQEKYLILPTVEVN